MLTFEGINFWGNPIFVSQRGYRYGCLDKLFDYSATEEQVLASITEDDLCYFGHEFDSEPNGGPLPKGLTIKRTK